MPIITHVFGPNNEFPFVRTKFSDIDLFGKLKSEKTAQTQFN